MNKSKTKVVNGTHLSSKNFLWAPDVEDPKSWMLPAHDPTSTAKTVNLLKNHLVRFAQMKIPATQRARLWERLVGAAIANGVPVPADRSNVVPAEPVKKPKPNRVKEIDPAAEIFADADRRATAFLKSLGLS